jgi:hypothetical protein
MRIRIRTNKNTGKEFESLALVRSEYDPSRKRNREVYIGSVSKTALPSDVPSKIRHSDGMYLTDAEVSELKAYLKPNLPPPVDPLCYLKDLPRQMRLASAQLESRAAELKSYGRNPKDTIVPVLDVAESAWKALFRSAQVAGLKRTMRRGKKKALTPEALA